MKSWAGAKRWWNIVMAAGAALLLQGCSRTLNVENGDVERAMAAIAQAGYAAREDGLLADASADSARKDALKKVLIAPLTDMGCDPDASLHAIASRFLGGDVPADKRDVMTGFLQTYASSASDLEHFGLISSATATLLRDNFSAPSAH